MIIRRHIVKVTLRQIQKIFWEELFYLRRWTVLDWKNNRKNELFFDPWNYYCGITNDIPRREREHNVRFINYIEVDNVHIARCIEIAMRYCYGYDTGRRAGNGGRSDSLYIYIYRKIPHVSKEIIE